MKKNKKNYNKKVKKLVPSTVYIGPLSVFFIEIQSFTDLSPHIHSYLLSMLANTSASLASLFIFFIVLMKT